MRRGEILALKWSELNFKTGELRIERQVYIIKAEVIIISAPKTKASIRTVILPPSLLKTLAVYKETVDSEWMFPSPTDNVRPRNLSSVRKRLQLILERAGCKKVRFHDLRHPYVKPTTKNKLAAKAEIPNYQHEFDSLRFLLFCLDVQVAHDKQKPYSSNVTYVS